MGVRIETSGDIVNIKNDIHRHLIRGRYQKIDSVLRFETACEIIKRDGVATNKDITDSIGCSIYLEKDDNLFESNDKLQFDATGIYHSFWNNTPSWEAVDKLGDLYVITWLANNEAGYTYFLPEDIANKYPELLKWLKRNLIEKDPEINEDRSVQSKYSWPDSLASADN